MIDSTPSLSLRMRSAPRFDVDNADNNEAIGCLDTLLRQGKTYRCRDYMRRNKLSGTEKKLTKEISVDESCREKMVEWSYKVSDHFHIPREIVACAISFLDRFVERCGCDRTAFKLAAMTSLYIATKTLNGKQISINTLAELSRGEFTGAHIAEMELIMLETLEWKLNPPTIQSFIRQLLMLMPSRKNMDMIHSHAMFLAELCIFDYAFVPHDRIVIALGAVMIAINGAMDKSIADFVKTNIFESLKSDYNVCLDTKLLESVQQRLVFLCAHSSEILQDDLSPIKTANYNFVKPDADKGRLDFSNSPVSVIEKGH
mmetsp:Transcript_3112/g.6267  ORF Transcript_3112/g.6267 Transcript_3112/m.6267 type:complete len:315 (-) Transcript_3112:170-1114(-)